MRASVNGPGGGGVGEGSGIGTFRYKGMALPSVRLLASMHKACIDTLRDHKGSLRSHDPAGRAAWRTCSCNPRKVPEGAWPSPPPLPPLTRVSTQPGGSPSSVSPFLQEQCITVTPRNCAQPAHASTAGTTRTSNAD